MLHRLPVSWDRFKIPSCDELHELHFSLYLQSSVFSTESTEAYLTNVRIKSEYSRAV